MSLNSVPIAFSSPDRGALALVLGFRFFALAAVTGMAALLPVETVARPLLTATILIASALGLIQHRMLVRGSRAAALGLVPLHVVAWSVVIHATGGGGSPLLIGYLLELPLSGAAFGRRGVMIVALAAFLATWIYALGIDPAFVPTRWITWTGVIGVCALIGAHLVGGLGSHQADIESRRKADAAEVNPREGLGLPRDLASGALIAIDEVGRVASLNPAAETLLKVKAGTVLGLPWLEVLRPDETSRARILETLIARVPQRAVAMVVQPSDGAPLSTRADVWPGPAADPRVFVWLETSVPPPPEDPVRRLGEAAACVAHQVKNSVHALQGYVRNGAGGPAGNATDPVTTNEYLEALRGLGSLADDVLALSGGSRPAREILTIQDVLRSARVLVRQASVRLSLPEVPLRVVANRSQVIHAVYNLLENAVRATPSGKEVEVRAETFGDRIAVEIVDAGPGLPAAMERHLGPVPSTHGSGLGVMAARQFLERSGGRLTFTSIAGGGTRCRVELPAAPAG